MDAPAGAVALTLRVVLVPSSNRGGLFAPGCGWSTRYPGFDHSLVPSAFVARTSTS